MTDSATCTTCGAVAGELGSYSHKDGRWHAWPEYESYNSSVGFSLWGDGSPEIKTTRLVTHDGAIVCRGCLIRIVRPRRPRVAPEIRERRRRIEQGQMEMLG